MTANRVLAGARISALVSQGTVCTYCRQRVAAMGLRDEQHILATRDHDIPKSRGGCAGWNLVIACADCNSAKGDMTGDEFRYFLESGEFAESFVQYLEKKTAAKLHRGQMARRALATDDLSDAEFERVFGASMDPRHAGLDEKSDDERGDERGDDAAPR